MSSSRDQLNLPRGYTSLLQFCISLGSKYFPFLKAVSEMQPLIRCMLPTDLPFCSGFFFNLASEYFSVYLCYGFVLFFFTSEGNELFYLIN